jgi:hypothetical protein
VTANVFRSLETNQRALSALRFDNSFAAMRLRVQTWLIGCASLFGLAGAIRYAWRRVERSYEWQPRREVTGRSPSVEPPMLPAPPP